MDWPRRHVGGAGLKADSQDSRLDSFALAQKHASARGDEPGRRISPRKARRLSERTLAAGGRVSRWRARRAAARLAKALRDHGDPGAASALALLACAEGHPLAGAAVAALADRGESQRVVDVLADHWQVARHSALVAMLSSAAASPTVADPRNVPLLLLLGRMTGHADQVGLPQARMLVAAVDDPDDRIRAAAADLLRSCAYPPVVEILAAAWLAAPDSAEHTDIVAANPALPREPSARLLVAALHGRHDVIAEYAADSVDALLGRLPDAPPRLAEAIRRALRSLADPAAQGRLRDEAIFGNPEARAAAVDAGYLPADDPGRALFFFLTEQWERYTRFDFDGRLLAVAYPVAEAEIQARLREVARRSGRADVLRMLLGGDRSARMRTMTSAEGDYLLDALLAARRHDQVWQLLFGLRFDWAMAAVVRLDEAGFTPRGPDETALQQRMVATARGYDRESLDQALAGLPWAFQVAEATVRGFANGVSFAPDAPHLAIGTNARQMGLWDLEAGRLLWRQQTGFPRPIGKVLHVGCGQVFVAERTSVRDNLCGLYVVDVQGARLLGRHWGTITTLLGLPGGGVLTASSDGTAATWSADGEKTPRLVVGPNWPRAVAVSPDGALLAVGHRGISLFDRSKRARIAFQRAVDPSVGSGGTASTVAFAPGGQELLVGTHAGTISTFAARPGAQGLPALQPLAPHPVKAVGIVPLPSGEGVVTADETGLVRAHSWPGRQVVDWEHTARRTVSLAVSPSGAFMAAGHDNGTVSLWDLRLPGIRQLLDRPLCAAVPADLGPLDAVADGSALTAVVGPLAPVAATLAAMLRHRFRHDIHVSSPAGAIKPGNHDIELG